MAKAGTQFSPENISEPEASQPDQQMDEPSAAQPTDEEIAVRAYHIYLERGEVEGNPDDDWLQAKRELSNGGE